MSSTYCKHIVLAVVEGDIIPAMSLLFVASLNNQSCVPVTRMKKRRQRASLLQPSLWFDPFNGVLFSSVILFVAEILVDQFTLSKAILYKVEFKKARCICFPVVRYNFSHGEEAIAYLSSLNKCHL